MLTLSVFRFLLTLATRLKRFCHRIVAAVLLRSSTWSALLRRRLLTFNTPRTSQSRIRLHANDIPVACNDPSGQRSQTLQGSPRVQEEHRGTLATLPVYQSVNWDDKLSRHRTLIPSRHLELFDGTRFDLVPATPDQGSQRYKSRTVRYASTQLDIPAGQQKFLSTVPKVPDGWRRHIHPEGVAFFYHEGLRLFTEDDITDNKIREKVLFCAVKLIERALVTNGVTLDDLTEIVLNVDSSGYWRYYFVDHRHRLVFWVDAVSTKDINIDLPGVIGYNHIRYRIDSLYWAHCELYPHHRILPDGVFKELRGMLNYARTDMMTTDSSSSPFGQDELVSFLNLVNSLKDEGKISDPYDIWAIARLMAYFTENQFLNFCGQPCARLNPDTPLFGQQKWNHRIMFKVIDLFLLGSPNEHAVRLQRVWVDGIIIQPRWKKFINRLTSELGRYTIFSTVMLAVNFSFLAVPGVTGQGSAGPIQIIIYCSVVSTVASIVFSFGLLNVYNTPRLLVARNVAEAMWTLSQSKFGMSCLAITHSLPIASLIWSMVLFSLALSVQIFRPKEVATTVALGAEYLIIVLFILTGMRVMRLFSKNDDGDDVDISLEENEPRTGSQSDIEQGQEK